MHEKLSNLDPLRSVLNLSGCFISFVKGEAALSAATAQNAREDSI